MLHSNGSVRFLVKADRLERETGMREILWNYKSFPAIIFDFYP